MAKNSYKASYDPRFPETDNVPLDSPWHHHQISMLIELLESHFYGRDDFFVGGNMFMYYDQTDPDKNAGPDVFFVNGVHWRPRRPIWAVWEEGNRFPNLIIDLMSRLTKNKGGKTNKTLYERVFQTPEYFMYDPETQVLEGWRLIDGRYQPIEPNRNGRIWSQQIELELGLCECEYWPGNFDLWLRLFDANGRMVPTFLERAQERAKRAEQEFLKAQRGCEEAERDQERAEHQREQVEQEQRRFEELRRLADEQRRRADAAEAELARLKALLEQSTQQSPTQTDEQNESSDG